MSLIKSRRRRLFSVEKIHTNETIESIWIENTAFTYTMSAPICWRGEPAELHFANYNKRTVSINDCATNLFGRAGFTIHGPALILTGSEMFYAQEVEGSIERIKRDLEHVGLNEPPIILPMRGYVPRHKVYSRNRDDAFAIRMAMP
jgi:hypothetical protein